MYTHNIELRPGFGQRLATARKAKKLTQVALGELLGCRDTTIWKWEKEKSRPRDPNLVALQQTTGIRRAWVAYGEEPMESDILEVAGFLGEAIFRVVGQRLHDVEEAPRGSFMSPTVEEGDLLLMGTPIPVQEGKVYLANTSEGARRVGRVYPLANGSDWVLYGDEDRIKPGTCLPVRVRESDLLGQVIGLVRPLGRSRTPSMKPFEASDTLSLTGPTTDRRCPTGD